MKSSRRDKATAVAFVALLHGAALLCVMQSTRLAPPQVPRAQSAVTLPPTLIRVALDTMDARRPVKQRASHRPPIPAPAAVTQPAQTRVASPEPAVPVTAPAPAAASAPARKVADAPLTEVAYLHNPPPSYPAASLRMREQGRVLVSVLVSVQGLVEEANVKESSGSATLDAAALTSVRTWRFVPATRAGAGVEARITIPVIFELPDD